MTVEGWDGKSIRQHLEEAERTASDALQLARGACDEAEEFKACLSELEKRVDGCPAAVSSQHPMTNHFALQKAATHLKVRQVREEIDRWNRFLVEARGVRAALDAYAALLGPAYAALPVPAKGSRHE